MIGRSLPETEYFDCELPRVRREMEDPEAFLRRLAGRRIVLDEIQRLRNPSELLKIAADHFPGTKVLATGSSTLEASLKFRDTLVGRKTEVRLTPMMTADLRDFGNEDLEHRLARGGLPPFFLGEDVKESEFQEWMDSYWAKDIQELFRLERHGAFQKFLELLFVQSGGLFEASAFAAPCEISRPTVSNYLKALEATRVAHVIRPYSSHRASEIVSAPKVYAFDTGFVRYFHGWEKLRPEDMGILWEHFVLNEIQSRRPESEVRYWRDKRGREVDFILPSRGGPVLAIECKWSAAGGET
ncbi:MAG TPA: ATP-binding protein, partial [Planctomycetota bacterium]|nr:ATP-binding protein [Planctomycetota bacterium]